MQYEAVFVKSFVRELHPKTLAWSEILKIAKKINLALKQLNVSFLKPSIE